MSPFIYPFPRVIRIEPAGACNLTCSHCPTGTIQMTRGTMRWETFELILKSIEANRNAVKVVVLYHGGEPLLNRKFPQMIEAVKNLGIPFVKTVSNGMLMTEASLAGIVTHRLDAIEFSLDGQSPEENNRIRRNCDFETVVTNVKRLIEYKWQYQAEKPKVYVSTTQFVDPATYTKGQKAQPPQYLLDTFTGKYASEITYKCHFAMRWPHMEVLEDTYGIYYDPYDQESINHCDHVENTMTVRWNGEVVPCCYDLTSQYVCGNVHQDDLAVIWNNHAYLKIRETIDGKQYNTLCENCNVVRPNVYLTLKATSTESHVPGQ
jgi:radical SAM protein with 4Fe4S-binding SPASM domain